MEAKKKTISMKKNTEQLFWDIMVWGLSPNIQSIFHPIQKKQANKNIPYQFPEPWNGDIDNAPIIFIGLNPSFNANEVFPHDDSNTSAPYWCSPAGTNITIGDLSLNQSNNEDFFENRFSSSKYKGMPFVEDLRVLLNNNTYSRRVRYWSFLEKVMRYELHNPCAMMGKDCALLEIVPCKSQKCEGIRAQIPPKNITVLDDFAARFWGRILTTLAQRERKIIVIGKDSSELIFNILKSIDPSFAKTQCFQCVWNNSLGVAFPVTISGTKMDVIFTKHPSSWGGGYKRYTQHRESWNQQMIMTNQCKRIMYLFKL